MYLITAVNRISIFIDGLCNFLLKISGINCGAFSANPCVRSCLNFLQHLYIKRVAGGEGHRPQRPSPVGIPTKIKMGNEKFIFKKLRDCSATKEPLYFIKRYTINKKLICTSGLIN